MARQPVGWIRPLRAIRGGLVDALADGALRSRLALTCSVILGATVFYMVAEGWRWIDALYFAVVTIATVGYGDLVPATDAGKLFTIAYVIVGVGLFVATAAALAEHVFARARRHRLAAERRRDPGAPPDEV